ncbi:MAG: D-tyrosyl-tRNA(Tyr) deacylase [Acidobacteria bacterium]|nr:MAG: D-tyrosyl-tRNA(Tyr) deacylase [Acidobacteriota bacterium]
MRAVVQRVSRARVTVDGRIVGEIAHGLVVLLGVATKDQPSDVQYIAGKIRDLRIFADQDGKMNRSVEDAKGAVLLVSQFTLLGDARKGRRPSFDAAAAPAVAEALYQDVARELGDSGLAVATGVFQADMQVELVNDGPVTILLDSTRQF